MKQSESILKRFQTHITIFKYNFIYQICQKPQIEKAPQFLQRINEIYFELTLQKYYMSEQFTFDELNLWSWNKSVSLKSYKNPNFTMSDVSNKDLDQQNQFIDGKEHVWNLQEFNKKADKKLKNRSNVKNFRQRKKKQNQKIYQRLKLLQAENHALRNQKYCKNCKKPYGGLIQLTQTHNEMEKQINLEVQNEGLKGQGKECFEFQKPRFYAKDQKQTNRNGKIWIALGMLMLVLGVHLYGFRGKQDYQQISISKIESRRLIEMYQDKSNNLDNYFNVNVKYESKDNPKQTQKKSEFFKKFKIFHEEQNEPKSKKYQMTVLQTLEKLQMMEEQNEKKIQSKKNPHKSQLETDHEVKFHKDLLYAIQAEIDDVGHYI